MSFSIGNTANKQNLGGSSSGTVTLSVSAGSVVVVAIHTAHVTTLFTVSSVTSAHLTFARRGSPLHQTVTNSGFPANEDIEEWWAYSSGALTNEVITVTLSGAPETAVVAAFECQGLVNPSPPWDSNISLPATNLSGATGGSVGNVTLSTTSAAPVVLFLLGSVTAPPTIPTGFTLILAVDDSNGVNVQSRLRVGYEVFGSAQSSVTYNASASTSNWMIIGDAFSNAPSGPPVLMKVSRTYLRR